MTVALFAVVESKTNHHDEDIGHIFIASPLPVICFCAVCSISKKMKTNYSLSVEVSLQKAVLSKLALIMKCSY